jgi:flotillin
MIPIIAIGCAISLLAVGAFIARNWIKCPPQKALIIYGRKSKQPDGSFKGYRLIRGGAGFRIPMLESHVFLNLGLMQIETQTRDAPNIDGVPLNCTAVANVKLSGDEIKLKIAVDRFTGKDEDEIKSDIASILEGVMRQIIGSLTVDQIVKDREALAKKAMDIATDELGRMGVDCDNIVIREISDKLGYIEALGKTKTATTIRDARIGEAEAKRDADIKAAEADQAAKAVQLRTQGEIANSTRDLNVKMAEYDTEVSTAQASAAMAGDIAKAVREKELVQRKAEVEGVQAEQQTLVAEKQAVLKQKQLIAEVIRPAEAERERLSIVAEGAKSAALINAEAAKQKSVIEANAAADTLKLRTNAEADAVKIKANADAEAARAKAGAEQARLTAEGEGQAAAEAAKFRQKGLAEADVTKATLLAEADGSRAKGDAEGAALRARGEGEAAGIKAKNEALAEMSEGARMMLVIERLPGIIQMSGEAMKAASEPMAHAIGAGLAAIDKVNIVDLGGSAKDGKNSLGTFAGIPAELMKAGTVFTALEQAIPTWAQKYLGLGVDPTKVAAPEASSEPPVQA